jgi:putative MATE family efflux protein
MFTKKQLYALIIPLIVEQLLAVTVGLAATVMVSQAGEAAVSGVALVDALNILLINIFSSLATGGAVVTAQYLGHKERDKACNSANQLLFCAFILSVIIMVISLVGNHFILRMLYGNIEEDIMSNAIIYFYITAFSFPFLAIYNSCAALFRAMGNSKISMFVSVIMNVVNIIGNLILVNGFSMGVMGVSIPTLVSRMVAAVIMVILISRKDYPIHIQRLRSIRPNWIMIKKILHIGIPNSLENSIFQIGKILVLSLVTVFGESAITANAVGGTVAGIELIPGSAIGLAMITIVGQCVGAGDLEQAKSYTKKLIKLIYLIMIVLNLCVILLRHPILNSFHLSQETYAMTLQIIIYHSICAATIWPLSFSLPNTLRASNDVKFTMITSIVSMWVWRIGFSFVLAKTLGLGVMGVWIAMTIDWLFRSICFSIRFLSGKWQKHACIE